MLQDIKKRKQEEGFTIIEVLIVLAIAGLILLIVFLAVPTLQRNSRNTGRKEDVGRLSSAVNDFVSNHSGTLPAQATWNATDCPAVLSDAGTLNQYTGTGWTVTGVCPTGTGVAGTTAGFYESNSGALTGGGSPNANVAILSEGTVCSGSSATTATGATGTAASLLYTLESGGGNWTWACQNIQ